MKILIIGGTRFVGRALSQAALDAGHELTLFHRGETNPDLFPQAERIQGDRDGDLDKLGDATWDVVIDTCGYVPRLVQMSAEALQGKVKRYVFISTLSVYADSDETNRDETAELGTLDDETTEEVTGETYGPLKVLCEEEVQAAFSDSGLIVRPGLIVGPHDPTNRFTYWVRRIAEGTEGDEVLAPGAPDYPTQFIDVHDLGEWIIRLCEADATGIYNANHPPMTLDNVLQTIKTVTNSNAEFTWVPDDIILDHDVAPFMQMPLWVPQPQVEPFMTFDVSKAQAAGLTLRDLEETVRDTLAWVESEDDPPGNGGISRETEQEILAAYHETT